MIKVFIACLLLSQVVKEFKKISFKNQLRYVEVINNINMIFDSQCRDVTK